MKISKALKEKNKLIKELNMLMSKAQENNSLLEGKTRSYNPREIINKIKSKIHELVDLKTKISLANNPIQSKIYRLSELKSLSGNIKGMSTDDGPKESSWRERDEMIIYTSVIKDIERDEMIQDIENEIEKIQEELDVYNHITDI